VNRRLEAGHQSFVTVHRLVGDGGDLAGVEQQTGHELLGGVRQVVGIVGGIERVAAGVVGAVVVEQRQVQVHATALHALQRLGHEGGVHTLSGGHLLHGQPERHHTVGHVQRVGVAQVDLVLRRSVLVEGVLHGNAHGFEGADGFFAQVPGDVGGGEVEERCFVQGAGRASVFWRSEVEELDVGCDEEVEAERAGFVEVATQHLARVATERRAVEIVDVAEHTGFGSVTVGPRQHDEGVGIGDGQHVAFLDPREAVDRRAVEAHAVLEGVLQFGRTDGEALEVAQDVGEPQTDQPNATFLDGAEHVVTLLLQHGHSFSLPMEARIGTGEWGNGEGVELPRPPRSIAPVVRPGDVISRRPSR